MKLLRLLIILLLPVIAQAQTASLNGRLTSASEPLAYATVALAGTTMGTTTNAKGYYVLKNIPNGAYSIVFSNIGYVTEQYKIALQPGQATTLNGNLKENSSKLTEVVVTGVSRKTELRNNPIPIAVMTKKEMDQNVNNNIIDAIVKGVPGVNAVTTGPNISKPFIRGLGYNRVLTLYDGMRQEGQQWGDEHGIEIDQYGIGRGGGEGAGQLNLWV
jgi:iron complex outermembrane receptor protein